jgi:hypothetical protein
MELIHKYMHPYYQKLVETNGKYSLNDKLTKPSLGGEQDIIRWLLNRSGELQKKSDKCVQGLHELSKHKEATPKEKAEIKNRLSSALSNARTVLKNRFWEYRTHHEFKHPGVEVDLDKIRALISVRSY